VDVVLLAFANFQRSCKSMTAVLFQRFKSKYKDVDIDCSGGKQGQPVNGAIAIMITGTISVLMRQRNIRLESGECSSGWSGIVERWVRETW
jgi:hypothetical protein